MCMCYSWDINSSWSFKDEDLGDQNHKQGEMSTVLGLALPRYLPIILFKGRQNST